MAMKLLFPRQHHHLDAAGDVELGAEADILALQLVVERRDLGIGLGEIRGPLVDEMLRGSRCGSGSPRPCG